MCEYYQGFSWETNNLCSVLHYIIIINIITLHDYYKSSTSNKQTVRNGNWALIEIVLISQVHDA